jgi:hypothetical protein
MEPPQIVVLHSFECHLSLIQYHSFLGFNLSSEFSIDWLSYLLFYHSIYLVFLLIGFYHVHLVRSCFAFDCSMLKIRYLGSWSLVIAVSRWKDFTGQKLLDFLLKIYFLNFNRQTMSQQTFNYWNLFLAKLTYLFIHFGQNYRSKKS